jgi:hypothetical protein
MSRIFNVKLGVVALAGLGVGGVTAALAFGGRKSPAEEALDLQKRKREDAREAEHQRREDAVWQRRDNATSAGAKRCTNLADADALMRSQVAGTQYDLNDGFYAYRRELLPNNDVIATFSEKRGANDRHIKAYVTDISDDKCTWELNHPTKP